MLQLLVAGFCIVLIPFHITPFHMQGLLALTLLFHQGPFENSPAAVSTSVSFSVSACGGRLKTSSSGGAVKAAESARRHHGPESVAAWPLKQA